jgi:hypothetical protein
MCEHACGNLSGNCAIEGKSARLGGLRFLRKDRAPSAVIGYILQYTNGTDRNCARTHSCKIGYFSVLRGRCWRLHAWYPGNPFSSGDDIVRRRIYLEREDLPIPVDNVRPSRGTIVKTKNNRKGVDVKGHLRGTVEIRSAMTWRYGHG